MISNVEEECVAFPTTFFLYRTVWYPLEVHEHGERGANGMGADVRRWNRRVAGFVGYFEGCDDLGIFYEFCIVR